MKGAVHFFWTAPFLYFAYGARAANGVILVTTKKGKLGTPQISYSGTFGIADEVSRPKMLNLIIIFWVFDLKLLAL